MITNRLLKKSRILIELLANGKNVLEGPTESDEFFPKLWKDGQEPDWDLILIRDFLFTSSYIGPGFHSPPPYVPFLQGVSE